MNYEQALDLTVRLARQAQATLVLETRATERAAAEQTEYEAKLAQRAERERTTGAAQVGAHRRRLCQDHARATSSTSPRHQSRSMKNPTDAGFEQDYNVQVAVDQKRLLIVGCALSHHPNELRKPSLRSRPSRPRSARQRRRLSMLAILVRDARRVYETLYRALYRHRS